MTNLKKLAKKSFEAADDDNSKDLNKDEIKIAIGFLFTRLLNIE